MTDPKIGETVKYLRTGGLFEVRKVVKGFVILDSQDRSSQVITGAESYDSLFTKISPGELRRENFNPRPEFAVPAGGRG
jgi:hypothetical protein